MISDIFAKKATGKKSSGNLKCFSTIAYQMEKHIQNRMKKLKQSSGINILQTIDGLQMKLYKFGLLKPRSTLFKK